MVEGKRDFDKEAATWDENPVAVDRSRAVAEAIIREVRPTSDMDALDYGAGTGLVALAIRPHVRTMTAMDTSREMLSVLEGKVSAQGLTNVRTMLLDLETGTPPDACFDLVTTAMTMHHVPDVPEVLRAFNRMLRPGGWVAIADLDAEDGSFHPAMGVDMTGVFHKGFEREEMMRLLEDAGFRDVRAVTAHVMCKESREYPVFLITARKA